MELAIAEPRFFPGPCACRKARATLWWPLVRHRRMFWWRVMVNGYRWAADVSDHFLRLFALVALFGGPVVVVAIQHYPPYWVIPGIAATILLVLGEGAYRTWADAVAETAKTKADVVPPLADVLSLELTSSTFQATELPYARAGRRLEIRCVNKGVRVLRQCRARLDSCERREGTRWVPPEDFGRRFLPWDGGGDTTDLAPGDDGRCAVVTHERRHIIGVHLLAYETKWPWVLKDGKFRISVTFQAADHQPFTREFRFESEGNEGQQALAPDSPRKLEWLG